MNALDGIDLAGVIAGDKRAWDAFAAAAAPVVMAVARRVMAAHGVSSDDAIDAAQDCYVRLLAGERRLLRTFDPARASLSTWLAVVARSAAVDYLRRRRQPMSPLDDVPESAVAVDAEPVEKIRIPKGLLTERQALVMTLMYDRAMEPADVAAVLKVDVQTVRSTHHKALERLREHFRSDREMVSGAGMKTRAAT
jgi:RNA polymerase sigma factor (sigma-70 family)